MNKTIEELKEIELNILKEFISICKKHNFSYYVLGGTMLGAVRHQGFIPWDDDIDVCMPRQDYERFLEIAQNELSDELFVQTNSSEPQNPFCYCKIRNSNTTFIESSCKKLDINHGIFIDVFPLDYYPADAKSQKKFRKKKKFYNLIIGTRYSVKSTGIRKIKRAIGKLISIVYPVKRAIKNRDKMYTSQTNSTILANNGGAWDIKEVAPAEWYGKGVELDFEGIKIVAPERYDLWLKQVYGDYMKLPPEEKRITHHNTEIIDTKKSYKEYMKNNKGNKNG